MKSTNYGGPLYEIVSALLGPHRSKHSKRQEVTINTQLSKQLFNCKESYC
jgi:hypothetical protein